MTTVNDIVLIHLEDQPMVFARVEDISPDHKPDWWHVKLLILQVPLKVVTWILRETYINGQEYTMGGKKMRLEKVVCPEEEIAPDEPPQPDSAPKTPSESRVISFSDLKKK